MITMRPARPRAEAVAIDPSAGTILAVGSPDECHRAVAGLGGAAGVHLGLHRPLDPTDELAAVVFTDALGLPGRPGLVRTALSGIVDDALDRRDPPRRGETGSIRACG